MFFYRLRTIVAGPRGGDIIRIQGILNGESISEFYEDLDGNEYDWDTATGES